MINSFIFQNDRLASFCAVDQDLEFARPGRLLLKKGGPIPEYFDEYGNINESGLDVVRRALEHKLKCSETLKKVLW